MRLVAWGNHVNNEIAFCPDGWLYVPLGSEFNREEESSPQRASILRVDPDVRGLDLRVSQEGIEIVARGVRNGDDLAFIPAGAHRRGQDSSPPTTALKARRQTPTETCSSVRGIHHLTSPKRSTDIREGFHYSHPVHYGSVPAGADTLGPIAEFIDDGGAECLAFNTGGSFPGTEGFLHIALYQSPKILAVRLFEEGDTFGTEVHEVIEFPCVGPAVTRFRRRLRSPAYTTAPWSSPSDRMTVVTSPPSA